jgi:subfamily B ATP-binding cassette protein MsbA
MDRADAAIAACESPSTAVGPGIEVESRSHTRAGRGMMTGLDPAYAGTYRRLLGYVRQHWPVIAAALIATAVQAGLSGAVPALMSAIIHALRSPTGRGAAALWLPAAIAVVFALRGVMNLLAVYGLNWVGRSVIRDLRTQLFTHFIDLPSAFFDRSSAGSLISKLTYNTEQVAEAISNAIVVLVRDSLSISVQIGIMLYYSWQLTLVVVVIGPVLAVLVGYMSRAFRRHSARIQSSMGDVTRVTEQSLQGQRIVKIFAGQDYEQAQFDDINQKNFRLNMRLAASRGLGDALTQYVVALGAAAVIFIVFSNWILQDLTAAHFVGFITAMGMLLAPLKRLTTINAALQKGIAAAQSLFETLDEPTERDEGTLALERARGDVEYEDVGFAYGSGKERVLEAINLTIPAGRTVALVGASGSGKSTLAGLLPRFYEPSGGRVLLDGVDIRQYRLRDLRRQISYVGQDVVLFDDTIAGNIAYGALAAASRAAIEEAAEAAFVNPFAAQLPDGLDTQVGERGARLSGGQRQRIAIARALLKDAPVLILDEATSALDTQSEQHVQRALGRLMRGRTTLVIAHRLSTVEKADRIAVMQDGKIVESGTHRELLERGGYYATLYRIQFAG